MDSIQIDLDFTGKELVSVALLAKLGAAFLAEDADTLAGMVAHINNLRNFEKEAINGLDKLDDAVAQAALASGYKPPVVS